MLDNKTIKYAKLSKDSVYKANKLNLSDRTIINHYRSEKQESWKMNTEEWINHLFYKKFKTNKNSTI